MRVRRGTVFLNLRANPPGAGKRKARSKPGFPF
jgi:hypothetical protein